MPGEDLARSTADVTSPAERPQPDHPHRAAGPGALLLGALGVVFGDIGTSPLYALQTVVRSDGLPINEASMYGVISLIVWSVTIIVSIKYVTVIMRADNEGEGGIMALIALVQGAKLRGRMAKAALVALGIFGAALFYGDGMITPAISVLSAVEGLKVASPGLASFVVPIALVVLTLLFVIQRFGTHAVGRLFGPVMATWFAVLALAGLAEVVREPGILRALSPTYGIQFFIDHGVVSFLTLGAVVLAVTGAEALYADMGHFGWLSIRKAWFFFVFPALTLNYLGQAALVLNAPEAIESPFFLLMPEWARLPMVLLATVATVVASQAVISGAFSVTRQAVQLGFLPRLRIRHTSSAEGQIYVPAINWLLFVAVVALVVGFGSSEGLASAYGIAVTGTLAIDTVLFFVVVRTIWGRPMWVVVLGAAVFLLVDLSFFVANLPKITHGGWFPLALALVVFTLLTTWQRGSALVTARRAQTEGKLSDFVEEVRTIEPPVFRAPGTAVCLTSSVGGMPLALKENVEHNHVVHEAVVVVSVQTLRIPYVHPDDRVVVDDLGYRDDGIMHVLARFGFQDEHNVPAALRLAVEKGLEVPIEIAEATYFVSRITIVRGDAPGMSGWRKRLFLAMANTSTNPVDVFCLPEHRIVTIGSYVEF
ncbi:potassium transporter Kup [Actinomycetes bacterium KLBMP 9759]